jgi:hypothetical protein
MRPIAPDDTVMLEWRRWNRLEWARIKGEATEAGDDRRVAYATWMLDEVLRDD